MRRNFRQRVLTLFLVFLLPLVSCGQSPDIADTAQKIKEADVLPPGNWYRSEAEMWEVGYIDSALLREWLKTKKLPFTSFRLFFGGGSDILCEVALVECETTADAKEAAALFAARLAVLKKTAKENYALSLRDATVKTAGKTAVYFASPCNDLLLGLT
ncbi:MAG: hypothetical protein MJ078_04805 [Clostridia bacterium]|nr:hypothetical protein [Clostridia bacterium]